MTSLINILRCPVTTGNLHLDGASLVSGANGENSYPLVDGIPVLLPEKVSTSSSIIEYYDNFGWEAASDGKSKESVHALDRRETSYRYTRRCISRLAKYFRNGGDYLLDLGSGAIPHEELLSYHTNFKKRVCVDLSITALKQAREKLDDRGEYVVADATNLPFKDGVIDAVTCNHVLYQIPAKFQRAAALEIWRVLKPGGVAVVVYRWPSSGIQARLVRLAQELRLKGPEAAMPLVSAGVPSRASDEPQPREWFEKQEWPFKYTYDCFRLVDNEFMKTYVPDGWIGQLFLTLLFSGQCVMPEASGRWGTFPVFVLRKP